MPEYYTERQAHWHNHLNMMYDPITGEAIAINMVDGRALYIPTGYFFERVIQMQLDEHGQPLVGSEMWARAQPWGWATLNTALDVLRLLARELPEARCVIGWGDVNTRFPFYNVEGEVARQAEIHITLGDVTLRRNAGLIAQTIARYMTVDPASGKVRRSDMPVKIVAREVLADAAEQAAQKSE